MRKEEKIKMLKERIKENENVLKLMPFATPLEKFALVHKIRKCKKQIAVLSV